jgi:hypothetical protein
VPRTAKEKAVALVLSSENVFDALTKVSTLATPTFALGDLFRFVAAFEGEGFNRSELVAESLKRLRDQARHQKSGTVEPFAPGAVLVAALVGRPDAPAPVGKPLVSIKSMGDNTWKQPRVDKPFITVVSDPDNRSASLRATGPVEARKWMRTESPVAIVLDDRQALRHMYVRADEPAAAAVLAGAQEVWSEAEADQFEVVTLTQAIHTGPWLVHGPRFAAVPSAISLSAEADDLAARGLTSRDALYFKEASHSPVHAVARVQHVDRTDFGWVVHLDRFAHVPLDDPDSDAERRRKEADDAEPHAESTSEGSA